MTDLGNIWQYFRNKKCKYLHFMRGKINKIHRNLVEFGGKLATRCELIDCCCMLNMILCQITAVVMMMGLLTICLNKGHNCQVPSLKATKSKFE